MQGRHLRRRLIAQPSCRQDAIRIGLLFADIAAVDPLLRTAADPGDNPETMQALEGIGDSAFAEVGLAGNRRIGGIQPPCCIVEEIEQEGMQYLQAAGADGAAMFAGFVSLPVKVSRAVPELESHLLRHWGELDWFCGALSPDRKFSIRLLRHNWQARQDPLGEYGHRCASSVEPRRPLREATGRSSPKQVGLAFLPEIHKIGVTSSNLCVSSTKASCGAPHRAPLACLGFW